VTVGRRKKEKITDKSGRNTEGEQISECRQKSGLKKKLHSKEELDRGEKKIKGKG